MHSRDRNKQGGPQQASLQQLRECYQITHSEMQYAWNRYLLQMRHMQKQQPRMPTLTTFLSTLRCAGKIGNKCNCSMFMAPGAGPTCHELDLMRDQDARLARQLAADDLVKQVAPHVRIHRAERVVHQVHIRILGPPGSQIRD